MGTRIQVKGLAHFSDFQSVVPVSAASGSLGNCYIYRFSVLPPKSTESEMLQACPALCIMEEGSMKMKPHELVEGTQWS